MKIAIVINTSWNIWNFRMGLITALKEAGHEVVAIAPKDEYSDKLVAAGCPFFPIEIENKGANPIKDLMLIQSFIKVYRTVKPDVILQYTIKPNIYGTLAASRLSIPVINNVSGLGTVFIRQNLISKIALKLYKFAFRYPKKVFFQNNDDRELFIEKGLVNPQVTGLLPGSGINLNLFTATPFKRNKPFIFLMVARLIYDKGLLEFIEATKILRSRGLDARFQLLGFIDPASNLGVTKKDVDGWISQGLVEYLGTSDKVASIMQEADCVVLPSYREGTPKTLLEAAALAKPIVTTNVPGCKETVVDRYNGFLCEVKNAADLADKMFKMASLPDNELQLMGNNSRKLAEEKFDEKIVVGKYITAIKELAKE